MYMYPHCLTLSLLLFIAVAPVRPTFGVDTQTGTLCDAVGGSLFYWQLAVDVAGWPGVLGTASFKLDANNTCTLCGFDCQALSIPLRLQCLERATAKYALLIRHPDESFLSIRESNMSRTALHRLVICLYSELDARQLAIPRY